MHGHVLTKNMTHAFFAVSSLIYIYIYSSFIQNGNFITKGRGFFALKTGILGGPGFRLI